MSRSQAEANLDTHIGNRINMRRVMLGFSQEQLAAPLRLTFQQVQKMLKGANRIGAGRLYQLSQILDVPVSYFYEDLQSDVPPSTAADPLAKRETLELVRAYYRIPDPRVRQRVFELVKAMGKTEEPTATAIAAE